MTSLKAFDLNHCPKGTRKFIERARKEQRDRLFFHRDFLRQQAIAEARKAKLASRYRRKILEKGMAGAGIDYEAILSRQAIDEKSVLREFAAMRKKLGANAAKVNQRHRQLIQQMFTRPGKVKGDIWTPLPHFALVPDFYDVSDRGSPAGAQVSIEESNNLLKFRWDTQVVDYWLPQLEVDYYFVMFPSQDGLLNVQSVATYNGFSSCAMTGDCWTPGFGNVFLSSNITVQQEYPNAQLHTDMAPTISGNIADEYRSGCFPNSGHRVYDSAQYLQFANPFVVLGPGVVLITVSVFAQFFGAHMAGELDFLSQGKSINVPGVITLFTPA